MVAFALLIILVSHGGFSYPVGPICNTSAEVFLRPETSHGPSDRPKVENGGFLIKVQTFHYPYAMMEDIIMQWQAIYR